MGLNSILSDATLLFTGAGINVFESIYLHYAYSSYPALVAGTIHNAGLVSDAPEEVTGAGIYV